MIAESSHYDVIIIGSGPAGQNAALEAANRSARVLVIEQELQVGGACVQYGTIPSKTLRETALTLSAFQRRSGDVYRVSRDAELSITSLIRRLNDVVHAHQKTIEICFERAGIERVCGRARFVSPQEISITRVSGDQQIMRGSKVIIATGSRPRNPPNIQIDHENILDSDSILSMTYLPGSMLIFGGGVIACEYASTFAALGVKVTMLDKAECPLSFVDPEFTAFFLEQLTQSGGSFRGGCDLTSVTWDGVSSVQTQLSTGETFHADKAFVALGRVANVDSLDLEKIGLRPSSRGLIVVNENCQTSVSGVYAVGDTIGPPALASASMEQGRRAAVHALGGTSGPGDGILPTGIYTIPEIATIGLSEQQAIEQVRCPLVARVNYNQVARAHIAASTGGLLKMIADEDGRKILGLQIVGDNATELIHLGQMAMIGGMPVDTFIHNTFNFPTMAEAYRLAAMEIVHQRESRMPPFATRYPAAASSPPC